MNTNMLPWISASPSVHLWNGWFSLLCILSSHMHSSVRWPVGWASRPSQGHWRLSCRSSLYPPCTAGLQCSRISWSVFQCCWQHSYTRSTLSFWCLSASYLLSLWCLSASCLMSFCLLSAVPLMSFCLLSDVFLPPICCPPDAFFSTILMYFCLPSAFLVAFLSSLSSASVSGTLFFEPAEGAKLFFCCFNKDSQLLVCFIQ